MKNACANGSERQEEAGAFKPEVPPADYEISIENDALAIDYPKLLKSFPFAVERTVRHIRNWKATDVGNVSGKTAVPGISKCIRIG